MSVNFLYSQTLASTVLPASRPFENIVLFHPTDEVPDYDGQ
jgi:hypothetical protein